MNRTEDNKGMEITHSTMNRNEDNKGMEITHSTMNRNEDNKGMEITHSMMNRNEDNKGMEMRTTKVVFETMGVCQQSLLFFGQRRLGSFFQSFAQYIMSLPVPRLSIKSVPVIQSLNFFFFNYIHSIHGFFNSNFIHSIHEFFLFQFHTSNLWIIFLIPY